MIRRVADVMQTMIRIVGAILLTSGVAVNFSNVVGRYLFARPIPWAEDFMVFANVWLIFLGAAIVSLRNTHLNVDVLRSALPPAAQDALQRAAAGLAAASGGFVVYFSGQFVARMYASGQRSISLDIPMYVPHAAVLTGFALMTLGAILACFAPPRQTGEDASTTQL